MRITNQLGLPEPLVNAVRNDPYTRGKSDISATQLIDSPQIRRLLAEHGEELEEDAAERIWALLGQSVHVILERAGTDKLGALAERRLFMEVSVPELFSGTPIRISGQFDRLTLLPDNCLQDYKVTSAWQAVFGLREEYERQLNVLAELCEANDYPIERLEIVTIFRDWQKRKAGERDYPTHPVKMFPIPLWSAEQRRQYIEQRLRDHFGPPRSCTDEERWKKPDSVAIKKEGRKTAVRVFTTDIEAIAWAKEKGAYRDGWVNGHFLERRPGRYVRCEEYCSAAPVCPQWQSAK